MPCLTLVWESLSLISQEIYTSCLIRQLLNILGQRILGSKVKEQQYVDNSFENKFYVYNS